MAPFIPLVAVLLKVSEANLDEESLLQMPVMEQNMATDQDECRCPGYYQDQCEAEAAQGCVWSDAGSSNKPWCQCLGDASVVPDPVTLPPLPPQPTTTTTTTTAAPTCGPRPELTNAAWNPSVEGHLQYQCEEGYSFSGSFLEETREIECLADGRHSTVRVCLPIDDCVGHSCGAFGACVDLHMDYTCNCLDGYELNTVEGEQMCGNVDDCQGHSCGMGGVCEDLIEDYSCNCNDGWEEIVESDNTRSCERIECGNVPRVDNVMRSGDEGGIFPWNRGKAVYQDIVEYDCLSGYSTNGQLDAQRTFSITCQANGEFTEVHQCLPVTCGEPEASGSATPVSADALHFGQSVEYQCPAGHGPSSFDRICQTNGQLSPAIACEPRSCGHVAADSATCVPMVCQRPDAPANWAWVGAASFDSQNPAHLRCADGYQTTTGLSAAASRTEITCHQEGSTAEGHSALPLACEVNTFTFSGRVRSALPPRGPVANAVLSIAGQTISTGDVGSFTMSLPAGEHEVSLSHDGFITYSGTVTISADTTGYELHMSPVLSNDEWRIVLTWGESPRDLDSHLLFTGQGRHRNCAEMFYGNSQGMCGGVTASLNVDDTSSWGPEVTTLSNLDSCRGRQCDKWVYKVRNYSGNFASSREGSGMGWAESQAVVTLYNGDHVAGTYRVGEHGHTNSNGRGISRQEDWTLLSIDSHGQVALCTNTNCD